MNHIRSAEVLFFEHDTVFNLEFRAFQIYIEQKN